MISQYPMTPMNPIHFTFILSLPFPLILNSRSLHNLSFLSVFTFHCRVRYFVDTLSSMLRCLASIERPFLHLWFTKVHAYLRTRSGHARGVQRMCAYIDVYPCVDVYKCSGTARILLPLPSSSVPLKYVYMCAQESARNRTEAEVHGYRKPKRLRQLVRSPQRTFQSEPRESSRSTDPDPNTDIQLLGGR